MKEVSRVGGYFVDDGERHEYLELDIAGLMSTANVHKVAEQEQVILTMLRSMGCHLSAPFMTLSFQSLLVVPELKMSDRGLFDSVRHQPVSPIIQ
jgi:adenine deaminase